MIGKLILNDFKIVDLNIFCRQNIIYRKYFHCRIIVRPISSLPLIIAAIRHIEEIQQAGKLISILIRVEIAHDHFVFNRILRNHVGQLQKLNLTQFPSGHLLRRLRAQMDIVQRNLFAFFFNYDPLGNLGCFQLVSFQRTCGRLQNRIMRNKSDPKFPTLIIAEFRKVRMR